MALSFLLLQLQKTEGTYLQIYILLSIKSLEDKNLYTNFASRKDTDLVVSIRLG